MATTEIRVGGLRGKFAWLIPHAECSQYEAAENYFKGRNVSNLLYLSRTWYAWANRDSNVSAMNKALSYAQKVSAAFGQGFEAGTHEEGRRSASRSVSC